MKRILFFYPSNKRTIAMETLMLEIKQAGHQVFLLTTCDGGELHKRMEEQSIPCFNSNVKRSKNLLFYLRNIFFLRKFCKNHKIDVVFSHLQQVNLISVVAQYLMATKVIIFRHHFKFSKGNLGIPLKINKNENRGDKIINSLAEKIVVPSKGVYDGILKYEKIKKQKLQIIPYLYDFSLYGKPNPENVEKIKTEFPCHLRIIMVSRLVPFKRHITILPLIKELVEKGFQIKLLILDEGPEKVMIQRYIDQNHLNGHIFLLGFRNDFLDYMKASDLILHPSLTEASNSVIKEMGLMEKAVAVCQGVGDFDEYIVHGETGFFMDIVQPQVDAMEIIKQLYNDRKKIQAVGSRLKEKVTSKFGNNEVPLKKYLDLLE